MNRNYNRQHELYAVQPVFVILVALPGSGKSTFSRYLYETAYYRVGRGNFLNDRGWRIVNQDQLGDHRTCERVPAHHLRRDDNVIIDSCNINSR